jgi:tRNA (cytidine32/uridine32-2'-O)-methyltransferase
MCRPQVPGNIGAVCRAMLNFGPKRLYLVAPECDHLCDAAQARARAGKPILASAVVVDTLGEALTGCTRVIGSTARSRTLDRVPVRPRQAINETLDTMTPGEEFALVFGSETSGMTNLELDRCHTVFTVPTCDELTSLNVATATSITLYELHLAIADRADQGAWPPVVRTEKTPERPATVEELEGMYTQMAECLEAGLFYNPQNPENSVSYLRRFFSHANASEFEARLWRAIWRRLNDRIRTPKLRVGIRKQWQAFLQELERKEGHRIDERELVEEEEASNPVVEKNDRPVV